MTKELSVRLQHDAASIGLRAAPLRTLLAMIDAQLGRLLATDTALTTIEQKVAYHREMSTYHLTREERHTRADRGARSILAWIDLGWVAYHRLRGDRARLQSALARHEADALRQGAEARAAATQAECVLEHFLAGIARDAESPGESSADSPPEDQPSPRAVSLTGSH